MRLPKLSPNNKAFTLIELIMTIIVMGIIALPLSITIAKQVQSVFQSQDYTNALNLARFDVELVHNTAYASINSATFSNYQGYVYDLTRTVTYAQGTALTPESLKQVSITVTKAGSATAIVTLVTYIAKNIIWGL
jgi:prepilin-type N-terminal cleavage/methylation domain-containing protein